MGLNIPRQTLPTPQQAFNGMLGVTEGDITHIPLEKLIPYKNQPFKAYNKDRLNELATDILQNGILSPVIVREHTEMVGCFEILAGHNRTMASKLAGITNIPCIIKVVDDNIAALIMVNTNLNQRHELLPSEKALAYKLQHDCMINMGENRWVVKGIATQSGESVRNIQRYIRLASLSPQLLNYIDSGSIAVLAGVELAYLNVRNQNHLTEYLKAKTKIKIDLKHAVALRELEKTKDLYFDYIDNILNPGKKSSPNIKLCFSKVTEFIPEECENKEEYILKALKFYKDNGGDTE